MLNIVNVMQIRLQFLLYFDIYRYFGTRIGSSAFSKIIDMQSFQFSFHAEFTLFCVPITIPKLEKLVFRPRKTSAA